MPTPAYSAYLAYPAYPAYPAYLAYSCLPRLPLPTPAYSFFKKPPKNFAGSKIICNFALAYANKA